MGFVEGEKKEKVLVETWQKRSKTKAGWWYCTKETL
jgi:hypothetical protein